MKSIFKKSREPPTQPPILQTPGIDQSKIMEALESDVMSSEEAQAKAVMGLLRPKNIKMLTELNDSEIICLSACHVIAAEFKDPVLSDVCNAFETLRVSKNRKGRGEIARMASGMKEQQEKENRFRRLFGGFK